MYRSRGTVKITHGKGRRYSNLAAFNRECSKRGIGANICELTNLRCLRDGGGLAVVKTRPLYPDFKTIKRDSRTRAAGTWRLHFASCTLLKQHLRGRVSETRSGMLAGRRR